MHLSIRWLDGRLIEASDAAVVALELAAVDAKPVCYTTALCCAGRIRHEDLHIRRLARDAMWLGLGYVDASRVRTAWAELGDAAFAGGSGIVRLEVHAATTSKPPHLLAVPRELGPEKDTWTAVSCPTRHPGPDAESGTKRTHVDVYDEARAFALTFAVDESLLADRDGWLVEGARCNLVVAYDDGRLQTPDLTLGAVRGVALDCLRPHVAELEDARIDAARLYRASELIAINAVRGARAITQLDGRPIGDGHSGPWARRLDTLLSEAP